MSALTSDQAAAIFARIKSLLGEEGITFRPEAPQPICRPSSTMTE